MGGIVEKASILKNTTDLRKAVAERDALQQSIDEAGHDRAEIQQLQIDKKQVEDMIVYGRKDVLDKSRDAMVDGAPNPITLSKGFVTFKQARHAQICGLLSASRASRHALWGYNSYSDSSVWVTSVPLEPRDILWNDLTADPTVQ